MIVLELSFIRLSEQVVISVQAFFSILSIVELDFQDRWSGFWKDETNILEPIY